jgi:hypothetical protein
VLTGKMEELHQCITDPGTLEALTFNVKVPKLPDELGNLEAFRYVDPARLAHSLSNAVSRHQVVAAPCEPTRTELFS